MKKVAVILRKLNSLSPTVVTAVIEPPKENVDSLEGYFNDVFAEIMQNFCNKFIEFKNADWDMQIITIQ